MENDDRTIGEILSRREALKLLGLGSAAFLASCTAPTGVNTRRASLTGTALDCVVRPQMTIGPYFVDDQLNRSDIRTEPSDGTAREGAPLTLAIGVFDVTGDSCTPIQDARVDVWHCDALGVYSGVSDRGFDTTGQQFLTIYPGWYSGRTVHIHFTIRTTGADGEDYQFTSQLYFDDSLTDQVHALEPYAAKGQRDTTNATDNIFIGGGEQLLLNLEGNAGSGFTSAMNIGLDLTDIEVGASDINTGGPGGPGGSPPPP